MGDLRTEHHPVYWGPGVANAGVACSCGKWGDAPGERAAVSFIEHARPREDHGDPDHPRKEWSAGWQAAFEAIRSGDPDAIRATGLVPLSREGLRPLLERLAHEVHGKGYTDSPHVRYVNRDEGQGGGSWERYDFDDCPAPDCVEARAALSSSSDLALSEGALAEALSRIEIDALIFQYGPESPSLPYAIARAVAEERIAKRAT